MCKLSGAEERSVNKHLSFKAKMPPHIVLVKLQYLLDGKITLETKSKCE